VKSSLHNLIPLLPFLLNHADNYELRRLKILILAARDARYIATGRSSQKTPLPVLLRVDSLLQICVFWNRCVPTSTELTTEKKALLLLREFDSIGMCLPSRCIAVDHSGFQMSCDNIKYCSQL
jgi:hypothetical protein